MTSNLHYWHRNLKSNQTSYFCVSIVSLAYLPLCFLVNGYVSNDQPNRCLFILNVLTTLYSLIFYYPSYSLIHKGYINLKISKWIFVLMCCSCILYFFRLYTELTTTGFFSILFGTRLFNSAPIKFPQTFTLAELVVIVNLLVSGHFLFFAHTLRLVKVALVETLVIEQAIAWLLLVIFFLIKLKFIRSSLVLFLLVCLANLFGAFVPLCSVIIQKNPFVWLFEYISYDKRKIYLLTYWFCLFTCSSLVLLFQWFLLKSNISTSKSLTATRKLFHILICCVYLPGLLYDREFLYLCSHGMLILLCLLETIRYFNVVYLGNAIDFLMKLFVDEKDREGKLILSHIYLLIGLSFPMWISTSKTLHISEFSGLLTIGVGDTFASLIGSQLGKHKWPHTNKSLEGTLALFLSQACAYYLLHLYEIFDIFDNFNFICINLALLISAFIETFTKDNDNLMLSIVTYPFLLLV